MITIQFLFFVFNPIFSSEDIIMKELNKKNPIPEEDHNLNVTDELISQDPLLDEPLLNVLQQNESPLNEPPLNDSLPNEPPPNEPLPNEPPLNEHLPNEHLPNETLPNGHLPNEPPSNVPTSNEPLLNEINELIQKYSSSTITNLIMSFYDIILKEVYKRAIGYNITCKNGKYIRFASFEKNPLKDNQFFNNITEGYLSSNKKMSYLWLHNISKGYKIYKISKKQKIDRSMKFIFISEVIPSSDDIHFIWKIYNEIKHFDEYKNKYIVISITENGKNQNNFIKNIVSNKFTDIYLEPMNDEPGSIKIHTSGISTEKIDKNIQNFLYKISVYNGENTEIVIIYTPTLSLNLKLIKENESENTLKISLSNKIANQDLQIIFSYNNPWNPKITLDNEELSYKPDIGASVFKEIMKINDSPYSNFFIFSRDFI
ncbi:hypothetical protein DMUE_0297 [Dictyocoela muelleri]|nr:hypothetical protein DMUE_0297 [Dictyocoela muelleri]